MPVIKTISNKKNSSVGGSVTSVVILPKYKTKGEEYIITKDVTLCEVHLDSQTTDKVTIKSMTDTLIIGDYPIDEEFYEVELQKGSSIELKFVRNAWYIMSSDGLKTS